MLRCHRSTHATHPDASTRHGPGPVSSSSLAGLSISRSVKTSTGPYWSWTTGFIGPGRFRDEALNTSGRTTALGLLVPLDQQPQAQPEFTGQVGHTRDDAGNPGEHTRVGESVAGARDDEPIALPSTFLHALKLVRKDCPLKPRGIHTIRVADLATGQLGVRFFQPRHERPGPGLAAAGRRPRGRACWGERSGIMKSSKSARTSLLSAAYANGNTSEESLPISLVNCSFCHLG